MVCYFIVANADITLIVDRGAKPDRRFDIRWFDGAETEWSRTGAIFTRQRR